AGRTGVSPAAVSGSSTSALRAGLAAGADPSEREDVVGSCREDRVAEEVLRGREAVEVLRAVLRPAKTDEERDDRLQLEEDVLHLRRDLLLLLGAEGRLPLVEERGRLRVVDVRPVAGVRGVLAGRRVLQLRE